MQHLIAFLNGKFGTNPNCRLCTVNAWEFNGFIALGLSDSPGVAQFGGQNLPSVALVCKNCGNTVLINAVIAGLVLPDGMPAVP